MLFVISMWCFVFERLDSNNVYGCLMLCFDFFIIFICLNLIYVFNDNMFKVLILIFMFVFKIVLSLNIFIFM